MSGDHPRTQPRSLRGLRQGAIRLGTAGAPLSGAGRAGVRGELPSRPAPTQAKPSRRGPVRQGRSYSGALQLDALGHTRSTACGSTTDGMGADVSGGSGRYVRSPPTSRGGTRCRVISSSVEVWSDQVGQHARSLMVSRSTRAARATTPTPLPIYSLALQGVRFRRCSAVLVRAGARRSKGLLSSREAAIEIGIYKFPDMHKSFDLPDADVTREWSSSSRAPPSGARCSTAARRRRVQEEASTELQASG